MNENQLFWAYTNILFEAFVVFILPLAFAIRELILLRRDGATATKKPDEAGARLRRRQASPERTRSLIAGTKSAASLILFATSNAT
jgi:hypothetical protein